jgi:Uma2 family endonuclease
MSWKRWTRDEYYRLARAGLLGDARSELIEGQVLPITPNNPPHETSVGLTARVLEAAAGAGFHAREEKGLVLNDVSEPQPDVVVVRGDRTAYAARKPGVADAVLVVEVADTTLAYDRGDKADLYAAAKVPVYWLVDVAHRQLEVRTQPEPSLESETGWRYAVVTTYQAHRAVTLTIDGRDCTVSVAALLPPV